MTIPADLDATDGRSHLSGMTDAGPKPESLRQNLRTGLSRALKRGSDGAAAMQAWLENGSRLRAVRLGGDLAVALGTLALEHGRRPGGMLSWGQAARSGFGNGAVSAAAVSGLLNLHRTARGEQNWTDALAATGREAAAGAGSGMASTFAANASILALKGVAVPLLAKAAAPAVAAAVAGWLAQEAADRGIRAAHAWVSTPDHALPEMPPETEGPETAKNPGA